MGLARAVWISLRPPLMEVEWIRYEFQSPLLKLNEIFPEGIEIPKMYVGENILHAPCVKTNGHTITTGAIRAFRETAWGRLFAGY